MFKKLILVLLLLFSVGSVNAETEDEARLEAEAAQTWADSERESANEASEAAQNTEEAQDAREAQGQADFAQEWYNSEMNDSDADNQDREDARLEAEAAQTWADSELEDSQNTEEAQYAREVNSDASQARANAVAAQQNLRNIECASGGSKAGKCVEKASFTIDVSKLSPGMDNDKLEGSTSKDKVNFLLGIIIQKLMIALGSLSLLIMTVGGGYMIMYHGQDEYLTKGKSIFMGGVIAMIVALSSYYLVDLLRTILY